MGALRIVFSGVFRRMCPAAGDALTGSRSCQPVLRALLFKSKNVCLVMADVMKRFVPRRATLVLRRRA